MGQQQPTQVGGANRTKFICPLNVCSCPFDAVVSNSTRWGRFLWAAWYSLFKRLQIITVLPCCMHTFECFSSVGLGLNGIIYLRDVYVSAVFATAMWLAGWVGGWLAGCHTPVLYQYG